MGGSEITSSGCVYVDGIIWGRKGGGGDVRKKDISRKKGKTKLFCKEKDDEKKGKRRDSGRKRTRPNPQSAAALKSTAQAADSVQADTEP